MPNPKSPKIFPSAIHDLTSSKLCPETSQTLSDSYKLAYDDPDFLMRDELRPVRLQLELLKPEILQQEHAIEETVVVFGSSRIREPEAAQKEFDAAKEALEKNTEDKKAIRRLAIATKGVENSRFYADAREFAAIISEDCHQKGNCSMVVVTGGGPGIMEAANRGADDIGAKSIGLNIVLPFEQTPNKYITPELSFQFHYFAIRKMHFLMRAKALVAFPGGFGTLDELTDTLTLVQTRKIAPVPIILFGRNYWDKVVDFKAMAEEGMISFEDLELIIYVDSAKEAAEIILKA